MGNRWRRTGSIVRLAFRPLRGRDLSLHAAAITFFGAIAIVPVSLLALWLTALVAGPNRVRRLTGYAVRQQGEQRRQHQPGRDEQGSMGGTSWYPVRRGIDDVCGSTDRLVGYAAEP